MVRGRRKPPRPALKPRPPPRKSPALHLLPPDKRLIDIILHSPSPLLSLNTNLSLGIHFTFLDTRLPLDTRHTRLPFDIYLPLDTHLSLDSRFLLTMPPGPIVTSQDYSVRPKGRTQAQQSSSKTSKLKTPAQQATNSTSAVTKKRGIDKDTLASIVELKHHRALAVSGAPPPDPDSDPHGGATEDDDELECVRPRDPMWAASMWLLDAGASKDTHVALGIQEIYKKTRGLVRNLTEYTNHTKLLTYGVNFHFDNNSDRPGRVALDCNDDVVAEELWPHWLDFFPGLEDHIDYLTDNPPLIAIIGAYVSAIAYKVRSDDLGRLNNRIVALCELEDPNNIIIIKDNRGWQDSRMGRLLCPIRYLPKFEVDPARFCTHVRNRLVRMFSMDYPSFFYDMALVDVSDAKAGLLCGKALVNCYKSLITGKSSVLNGTGHVPRGQRSIADEYELKSVSLYSIIYIGLLGCSVLSDHEWIDSHGKFWKAQDVVFSIMEIAFNFPEWHTDLIHWWDRQIFGDDNELDSDAERDLEGTAFYQIMAQKDRAESDPDDDDNNNKDYNDNDGDDDAPASSSSHVSKGGSE